LIQTPIVFFWKQFYGVCGLGYSGATCLLISATRTAFFRRLRRWAESGVFERIFKEISGEPEFEYAMSDGTIVQVN